MGKQWWKRGDFPLGVRREQSQRLLGVVLPAHNGGGGGDCKKLRKGAIAATTNRTSFPQSPCGVTLANLKLISCRLQKRKQKGLGSIAKNAESKEVIKTTKGNRWTKERMLK